MILDWFYFDIGDFGKYRIISKGKSIKSEKEKSNIKVRWVRGF